MKLYLELAIERLNVDVEYFFRMAYVWKFSKCVDVRNDAAHYRTCGIIPQYVLSYLEHLKSSGGLPTPNWRKP